MRCQVTPQPRAEKTWRVTSLKVTSQEVTNQRMMIWRWTVAGGTKCTGGVAAEMAGVCGPVGTGRCCCGWLGCVASWVRGGVAADGWGVWPRGYGEVLLRMAGVCGLVGTGRCCCGWLGCGPVGTGRCCCGWLGCVAPWVRGGVAAEMAGVCGPVGTGRCCCGWLGCVAPWVRGGVAADGWGVWPRGYGEVLLQMAGVCGLVGTI